jgi:hypothetical protein
MRLLLFATLAALLPAALFAQPKDAPAHGRPYFMPPAERERLHGLVAREDWARAEHGRLKGLADKGDGYAAAFLYALDGDARYLPVARKWLLERWGPKSYWVSRAAERLKDDAFFKAGQPGIPEVYYDTDLTGLLGYDWAARGLDEADRKTVEAGIVTWSRYNRGTDRHQVFPLPLGGERVG